MTKKQSNNFDFKNFKGFTSPQYTPVPDLLFDHIMQELNESELKVLLYIIRRTFGFKRDTDNISLNQLADGITTKDGRVLDRGVGLNRRSVARALSSLKEKNLITAHRRRDAKRGNLPTTYSLKMEGPPSDSSDTTPSDSRVTTLVTPESPTINSSTINRTTTKSLKTTAAEKESNTSSGERSPKADVVVALTVKGISEKVAQRLANRYKEDRIKEKIGFLEYLQETDPNQVKKSAPGWLRRAIEDNYAAPAGYAPDWRDQQESEARKQEETQQQREQWEQQRAAEEAERQAQAIKAREEQLKPLEEHLGTSETEEKTWSAIVNQTIATDPAKGKIYFAGSQLLSQTNGRFIIWMANKTAAKQAEQNYGLTIIKLLAKQHNLNLNAVQITYLYPNSPETEQILQSIAKP